MKLSLLQIIKEEIQDFLSNWQDSDEPSIADRIYAKNQGIETQKKTVINAELIGYVDKQFNRPIYPVVPVYKNPGNLGGFYHDTRGILLSNGDLYLAQNYNAVHDNILDLLAEHGIVSYAAKFGYSKNYPDDFVAVVRAGNSNTFGQSSAYDDFPDYYEEIFNTGNRKQPVNFKSFNL